MLTSVVYPPQCPVQAPAVYQSNGGAPNEDRALPPLNRTTMCPSTVSEMSQRSADAFLAPRRHNPMKQSLQKPYKCPMCPYSSYIGALCEQHVANVHSPQAYLPMPIEPPIMCPIPMGQLSPQQPQPHGLPMMMHSPNMQPNVAIPVAAYFAPVVQVATPPQSLCLDHLGLHPLWGHLLPIAVETTTTSTLPTPRATQRTTLQNCRSAPSVAVAMQATPRNSSTDISSTPIARSVN